MPRICFLQRAGPHSRHMCHALALLGLRGEQSQHPTLLLESAALPLPQPALTHTKRLDLCFAVAGPGRSYAPVTCATAAVGPRGGAVGVLIGWGALVGFPPPFHFLTALLYSCILYTWMRLCHSAIGIDNALTHSPALVTGKRVALQSERIAVSWE